MNIVSRIFGTSLVLALTACGGGGGGGGETFYGGIWDFAGSKMRDDCNSGASSYISSVLTVNQDGNRVVANVGQTTMSGEVNEYDGFDVMSDVRSSGNCAAIAGYSFRDASDGEALAAAVAIVRCGRAECTVGWGGNAVREGGRALAPEAAGGGIEENLAALIDACAQGSGIERKNMQEGEDLRTVALAAAWSLLGD